MSATSAWICTVCGYVHQGGEAPEVCPVCGATKDLFEPFEQCSDVQATAQKQPSQWRCLNCEYIHAEAQPPEMCPICGAPAERFEAYEPETAEQNLSYAPEVVIVGGGIAGVSAAEAVRRTSPRARITLATKEPDLPYYRLNLTRYLANEISREALPLHPEEWYQDNQIELLRSTELRTIDRHVKTASLRNNKDLYYDKLIITAGSHPFLPPFPGGNRENVTSLRTRADADFILVQASVDARIVVIGGGVLGLETAAALARRGCEVTLLEGHQWLMPRQLNKTGASLLEKQLTDVGVNVVTQARTKAIEGDECVRSILLEDGTSVPADLAIITTGVRANSYLARLAGLEVNRGIVVNNYMTTSDPDILAAGDAAEHHGMCYGTWGPSQFQGAIAGMNAAGSPTEFAGMPRSNMLKVLNYNMFSVGQITAPDASYQIVESEPDENYRCFFFHDSHMVGAILMGETSLAAQAKHVVENEIDCSAVAAGTISATDVCQFLEKQM